MRKYLEEEMLAASLRGRVRYGCTSYAGMDGCRVFEIVIDGVTVKRFSWETVNTYFINKGYKENSDPYGKLEYWEEFHPLLQKYPMSERTEYTDEEFAYALEVYRNQDIQYSVLSEDSIVRMFAILDRRVGKRTLERIKENLYLEPAWLCEICKLRLGSEKMI